MNQHAAVRAAEAADMFVSDDFHRMMSSGAFVGMRVELVRGELVKMPPAGPEHCFANALIVGRLFAAIEQAERRLGIDVALRIDEATVRAPDVVVLARPLEIGMRIEAADVTLVVEVADTTLGRDLDDKAIDYARSGIPIYWVADVSTRTVHVFMQPDAGRYRQRALAIFDEPLKLPGMDRVLRLT